MRIIAFACEHCAYPGIDLAGLIKKEYPPNIIVVKVQCSGRVDPVIVLNSIIEGADGVFILGCRLGECNFIDGNYEAKRRVELLKQLFKHLSLDENRINSLFISAHEYEKIISNFKEMDKYLKEKGEFPKDLLGKVVLIRDALNGERLRVVLGSQKRAFELFSAEEQKYKEEMLKIAIEEIKRQLIISLLREKAMTIPELSEKIGLPTKETYWHIKAMKRRRIVEEEGIKQHYPLFKITEITK